LDTEAMAEALEATGEYRVLRKIQRRPIINPPDGAPTKTGLFVDVETTGLNPDQNEIIELAMVPFTYGLDGRIFSIGEPFHQLREPRDPIPAEITAITGITQDMVAGQAFDSEAIEAFIENADLIVAHNASFDRRFLENYSPAFEMKPWACSIQQVDWRSEGFEGTRLGYLVAGAGYFYDRHRAVNDCYAAIELLAMPLPQSGNPAFKQLLEKARLPTWRIWASHAPFDLKDVLRERGYRWSAGGEGTLRAWFMDVAEDLMDAELAYLQNEIYQREVDIPMRRIDAYTRFSRRV
jgi:DNA polymerase-3 subunit epsilon